jgi:hypothetical protein
VALRDVSPAEICRAVRVQGGDPGDTPSANARMLEVQS